MEQLIISVLMTILVSMGMGILLVFFIFKQAFSYWDKFDIPVVPPQIPHGSLGNMLNRTVPVNVEIANAYQKLKDNKQRHGGIYILHVPYYLPVDPVIIKNICIKDFSYFSERKLYKTKEKDPLSVNLLTVEGQEWKDMRNKLTTAFTIHKLKLMFPLFQIHSDRLVKKISDCVSRMEPVDIKEVIGCFTTEIMGSCAFGVQCNSLENPECNFRKIGKRVFHVTPFQLITIECTRNYQKLAKFLGMVTFPKNISDFAMAVVNENYDYRVKNNKKCNDIFQSLIEWGKNEIDDNAKKTKIAAQSLLFLNAGSETSSIAITCAIYELACNSEIQDRLRKEVLSVLEKHNGMITYEALMEMEYLGQVVDESLRKYPPAAAVTRRCVQDYHVEGTDLVIEKGTKVCISILGVHKDPENYPNPEVFDPERFNETNKSKRPLGTFLPFLDGPRNCIGLKLGYIQVKLGIVSIMKNFKFSVNSKTGTPVIDLRSTAYRFSGSVFIDFEKI